MTATRMDLTCCCGAQLNLVVSYASMLVVERRAFDEAHAVCRERPAAPSRLCSPAAPPPPPKPAPLPNPVVPST